MMKRSAVFGLACALSALLVVATHAQGTAFTYQGLLKQNGNPVNGTFDFRFRLYDLSSGGTQVGSTVFVNDLNIQNGLFTAVLDFGAVWNGTPRYLEIGVRSGSSTGSYQVLTPRVKINPTPYAIRAGTANPIGSAGGDLSGTYPNPTVAKIQGRSVSTATPSTGQVLKWNGSAWAPASDNGGTSFWQQSGSNIYYNSGKVGIGTTSPAYRLHVETSSGPRAIYGYNTATSGINYGVYGVSDSTSGTGVFGLANATSGNTRGVEGKSKSTSGRGVFGWATATSGTNYGVYGQSDSNSGVGVYGVATATSGGGGSGVYGQSKSTSGVGVYGWASANSGTNYGVFGISDSPNGYGGYFAGGGYGVYGVAYASSGTNYGVYGRSDSPNGYGGYFIGRGYFSGNVGIGTTDFSHRLTIANTTASVLRLIGPGSQYGMQARLNFGDANYVYLQEDEDDKLTIYASLRIALLGGNVGIGTTSPAYKLHVETSSSTRAIYGNNTATSGTNYGVYGVSASTSGAGVYGLANATSGAAYGVEGKSKSAAGRGVYGLATATSGTTFGVYGRSASIAGRGVYGWATATSGPTFGVQGFSDSTSGMGVYGEATATSGTTYGVYGRSDSTAGRGVYGWAAATSGTNYGVIGLSNSTSGYGVYSYGRFTATGTKSFQIDHPLSPETHYLNHFCTEGPEPYNVYRGNVVTDAKGYATITLPDYFESINRDPTYHLTVVDDGDDFVLAKVVREIRNNQFTIRTSKPFVKVSWEVKAIRNDRWVQEYGYQTEQVKPEEHRGKYLHPELYGQPKEMGIHYTPEPERPEPERPEPERLEPNEAPVKP